MPAKGINFELFILLIEFAKAFSLYSYFLSIITDFVLHTYVKYLLQLKPCFFCSIFVCVWCFATLAFALFRFNLLLIKSTALFAAC